SEYRPPPAEALPRAQSVDRPPRHVELRQRASGAARGARSQRSTRRTVSPAASTPRAWKTFFAKPARSIERGGPMERAPLDRDLDGYEVLLQRGLVDLDAQTRAFRKRDLPGIVRQDVIDAEVPGQRLRRERVFTDRMLGRSGVGLQRGAEC